MKNIISVMTTGVRNLFERLGETRIGQLLMSILNPVKGFFNGLWASTLGKLFKKKEYVSVQPYQGEIKVDIIDGAVEATKEEAEQVVEVLNGFEAALNN